MPATLGFILFLTFWKEDKLHAKFADWWGSLTVYGIPIVWFVHAVKQM